MPDQARLNKRPIAEYSRHPRTESSRPPNQKKKKYADPTTSTNQVSPGSVQQPGGHNMPDKVPLRKRPLVVKKCGHNGPH